MKTVRLLKLDGTSFTMKKKAVRNKNMKLLKYVRRSTR